MSSSWPLKASLNVSFSLSALQRASVALSAATDILVELSLGLIDDTSKSSMDAALRGAANASPADHGLDR